jgi:hypothetical protein
MITWQGNRHEKIVEGIEGGRKALAVALVLLLTREGLSPP